MKPFLGIRLMWVQAQFRRRGIAAKLIDAARSNFLFGITFPLDQVAFSQPTELGFLFAKKYVINDTVWCYAQS